MPRPTDEKKGRMLKIRISDELYEELESRGENLSQTVREILKGGGNVRQNELPFGIDMDCLNDMDSMKSFMGGSVGEMIRMFDECLNDGTIYFEGGTFVGRPPIDLDRFLEKCREVGADPQKVLDKATAGIR